MNDINIQRRGFLKTSLGVATVVIAPGMLLFDMAHGKSQPVSGKVRWGMLIDTTQCREGCNDCVAACNKENGLSGGTNGQARSPLPNPLPQAGEGANDSLRETRLKSTDSQWIRKIELKDVSSGR